MSVMSFLIKVFGPRDQTLGTCPFHASFLRVSSAMNPELAAYIGESIEHGIAHAHASRPFEWSFRLNKEIPGAIRNMHRDAARTITERPAFHALTTEGTFVAATFNSIGGGFSLRSKTPIKRPSEIELSELYPPPCVDDVNLDSFWGLCPANPQVYASQHAEISAALSRNLRSDQFEFNNYSFQCEFNSRENFWLRIATIKELNAIDMPAYFWDEQPDPSNPVMLSDPEHTVVEESLPFSKFENWIKESLQRAQESQS